MFFLLVLSFAMNDKEEKQQTGTRNSKQQKRKIDNKPEKSWKHRSKDNIERKRCDKFPVSVPGCDYLSIVLKGDMCDDQIRDMSVYDYWRKGRIIGCSFNERRMNEAKLNHHSAQGFVGHLLSNVQSSFPRVRVAMSKSSAFQEKLDRTDSTSTFSVNATCS